MATDRYSAKIRASPKFKAKVKAASSTPTSGNYSAKVRASPKFQAKVQAARKPDSALTPTQRAARAWILKTQTPVTPGSSLSQAALASEAKAAATEKYAPAQQQATSNLKSAQQFASNTQDWYRQYQQAAAQNAQQVQAANAQANTAIQNLGGATAGLGGTDPQAGQANNVRQAMLGSIGALIAGQGANALRFADTQRNQIAPLQGQQASGAAEGIVRKALDDLKTLALQKGSFTGTYKGQRITDEQRNALAAQTLNNTARTQGAAITGIDPLTGKPTLPAKKIQLTAKQQAAALQEKKTEFGRKTHPNTDVSNAVWYLWGTQGPKGQAKRDAELARFQKQHHPVKPTKPPAGPAGPKPPTPLQQTTIINNIQSAADRAKKDWATGNFTRDQIRAGLRNGNADGHKYTQLEINAAMNYAFAGGLTQNNVDALHAAKIKIRGRLPILHGQPTAPAPASTNAGGSPAHTGGGGT